MNIQCNHHVESLTVNEDDVDGEYRLSPAPIGLPEGEYTFLYDYPLTHKAKFKHTLTPGTRRIDILMLGKEDYKKIYEAEEAEDGNPGMIPGMLNRMPSHGPYGIWGHILGDLFFECVTINKSRRTISFSMGS